MDEGLILALEEALVRQWHHFGLGPGASWHEDDELTWIEAPVAQLPYNGVFRSVLPDDPSTDERIRSLASGFAARRVAFLWVIHPTARPADLGARLEAAGIPEVETVSGMVLDLDDWSPRDARPDGVEVAIVDDLAMMDDFEELAVDYWHLLPDARGFMSAVNRRVGIGPDAAGVRFVAYADGVPAGKMYLSFLGELGTAAVFGMSVPEKFRGRGLATTLMNAAMEHARELGYERVVLHSTDMAANLYRRIGFRDVAPFVLHATEAIHAVG